MKLFSFLSILAIIATTHVAISAEEDQKTVGKKQEVFVLPLKGPIDKSMLYVFRRAFREVKRVKPMAIIIDMDTPGGGLKQTEEIIAWMRSVKVPIYSFVNRHAQSAGAIISLGADGIFMAPGSRIGSAMPIVINPLSGGVQQLPPDVKEKILSDVRSMVRGLAQENGHSEDIAVAMVDAAKEVKIGDRIVCKKGELLNLTGKEAIEIIPPDTKPLLARAIVSDIPALLNNLGIENPTITRFELETAENLARYITMIGPLLLALGVLGIYLEIKTPGFGVPGISGILLLMIYFFGHYVAGLAGIEDIVLVVLGFLLLAVEVFLIPGFGIIGFLGLLCIATGFILGMIPHLPDVVPPLPNVEPLSVSSYLQNALQQFLFAGLLAGAGAWFLGKVLPRTPLYRNLILHKALTQNDGYVSSNVPKYKKMIGQKGITATTLRPAGIAMIGDQRLDVVSNGDLIAKNTPVKIIDVQGSRIVVDELLPETGQPVSSS